MPLAYPSQVWAELLGLENPSTAGARRVSEAQRWLENYNFITVEGRPGRASRVTVLNETGDGTPYTPPGRAASQLRDSPNASEHYYIQIPHELWTSGYMCRLAAPGLALFLLLLDQQWMNIEPGPVWFSPRVLTERYALSDDTRAKGMNELRELRVDNSPAQAHQP